jgi:hypothetical protein
VKRTEICGVLFSAKEGREPGQKVKHIGPHLSFGN